jgi:hypothetical protein
MYDIHIIIYPITVLYFFINPAVTWQLNLHPCPDLTRIRSTRSVNPKLSLVPIRASRFYPQPILNQIFVR